MKLLKIVKFLIVVFIIMNEIDLSKTGKNLFLTHFNLKNINLIPVTRRFF